MTALWELCDPAQCRRHPKVTQKVHFCPSQYEALCDELPICLGARGDARVKRTANKKRRSLRFERYAGRQARGCNNADRRTTSFWRFPHWLPPHLCTLPFLVVPVARAPTAMTLTVGALGCLICGSFHAFRQSSISRSELARSCMRGGRWLQHQQGAVCRASC